MVNCPTNCFAGTGKKMLESDPDFAMGHIFTLGMEAFGKWK